MSQGNNPFYNEQQGYKGDFTNVGPPPGYPGYQNQGYYQGPPPDKPPQGYYQSPPPPGPNYNYPPPQQQHHQQPQNFNVEANYQPDDTDAKYYMQFQNKRFRKAFIIKVFSIVFIMLAWTVAISAIFYSQEPIKQAFRRNNWIIIVCSVVGFAIMLAIACFNKIARSFPLNVIMLAIFTVVESIVVAAFTAQFNTSVLIISFIITAGIVIACIVLAAFGCIDFTKCGTILCYITIFVFISVIVVSVYLSVLSRNSGGGFSRRDQIIFGVISIVVGILSSVWLIFDLQMILGGRRYSLGPDDYVFGALAVYIDLVNIFLSVTSAFNIFSQ